MLTTVEKLQKNMPDEDPDYLAMIIAAASQAIEEYCNRSFKKQAYTEILSGVNPSKYLNLRNYPIHEVTSMHIEGYTVLEEGRLFRQSGWPAGENNISVQYIGGYVLPSDATEEEPRTLPMPLELACILYCQTLLRDPGIKSERVGSISVTYGDQNGLPGPVKALVSPYVGRWV
ncbi:phage gp6-like head-tail connector protein [Paenibacillus sp. FSL H8-0317]|uniref:phage gp6-like head-tail connector protein n=1 Tax=Paenibacillus sp. FSL H8-0317 TaxID=2921385 RepID=UPI00324DD1AA